jgi:hypothetical protein
LASAFALPSPPAAILLHTIITGASRAIRSAGLFCSEATRDRALTERRELTGLLVIAPWLVFGAGLAAIGYGLRRGPVSAPASARRPGSRIRGPTRCPAARPSPAAPTAGRRSLPTPTSTLVALISGRGQPRTLC